MSRSLLARLAPLGFAILLGCPTDPADDGGFSTFTTDPGTTEQGDGDGDTAEAGTMDQGDGDGDGDMDQGDGDGDTSGSCGDGVVDEGEQCDLGDQNSDNGQCTSNCMVASCGDGLVYEGVEECDDGNPSNTDECV